MYFEIGVQSQKTGEIFQQQRHAESGEEAVEELLDQLVAQGIADEGEFRPVIIKQVSEPVRDPARNIRKLATTNYLEDTRRKFMRSR